MGAQRSPLIDGSLSLSPSSEARHRKGRLEGGGHGEGGRGGEGQAALGLHRCTNSGNCLSSKRQSFLLHKGLIERVKQCICIGMIIFTL